MIPTAELSTFLERWRALASPRADPGSNATTCAALDPEQLRRALALIGPALAAAKRDGASFDVWRMAGLGRKELRNAHALAQLLDPRGDHGLSDLPLQGLFDALQTSAADCPRPGDLSRCTVRVERYPPGSNRDRIDIEVAHPSLLLFLEVKIDSGEGIDQLKRYAEAAAETAMATRGLDWRVAFLTVRPARLTSFDAIPITWHALASAMRRRLAPASTTSHAHRSAMQLLDHFCRF